MKQWITKEQVMELSPAAQQRLAKWFDESMQYDDDLARVFIPEEASGEYGGLFSGRWGDEYEFTYPEDYDGKLKNHQGTILPLLDIGQMMEIISENDLQISVQVIDGAGVCDYLWKVVKALMERDIVVR
jgi:hypothetical protein